MYIAVSGNLGSGKSTITKGLAGQFHCPAYPVRPYDESYISDLFKQPNRWTFEAQASFLLHKYNEIKHGTASGKLFLLDRTIYEDVEVFARKFHEDGTIDTRSMQLLEGIYENLLIGLKPPSLILYCACPPEICAERVLLRPRRYQTDYPKDHISKLDKRLSAWLGTVTEIPVLKVDTVRTDFRNGIAIRDLALEIDRFVSSEREYNQPDLFFETEQRVAVPKLSPHPLFEIINSPRHDQIPFPTALVTRRTVYLAAPFSSKAQTSKLNASSDQRLFAEEYIESISGSYQRQLLSIAGAIESHGYRVFLPHRDVNGWGRRAYPPSEIANKCIDAVANADYFVGLIAESFGSHVELGVALGMSKPTLLLVPNDTPISFFGKGILGSGRVQMLRGRRLSEVVSSIRRNDPFRTVGVNQ